MKHINENIIREAKNSVKPSAEAIESAEAFQSFLTAVETGAVDSNDSAAFRKWIRKNRITEHGWMDYLGYLFIYKHEDGSEWTEDELTELRDKFDNFAL